MHEHHGHGAHGGHDTHGGHDKHAGHDPEMFRRKFWLSLALTVPIVVTSDMVMDWFGYSLDFPGIELGRPGARHGRVLLRRLAVPGRCGRARSATGRPGMMLLISMAITVAYAASLATTLGCVRPGLLVGAGRAGHHHAARPLAGDEGDRPGPGRAGGAGRAAAGRRRAGHRGRRRRAGAGRRPAGRRHRAGALRRPGAGRRPGRRRRRRAGRVDDHRRVPAGAARRSATGWWPARSRPTRPSGCGSTRSARTPRWPASAGWSRRRRRPAGGRRCWPTGSPRCCSTSPPRRRLVTFVVWWALGRPGRRRWCVPSRSW